MKEKYIIAGTFYRSDPDRAEQLWASKISELGDENRQPRTVAECYGDTEAEAEARAQLCVKALNESEAA